MGKLNVLILFLCFSFVKKSISQDTLKLMSYNILNYASTNANKNRYTDLRTILTHVNPDVVLLCEIADAGAPKLLLDSSFNKAGIGTFTMSQFIDGTDTDNMLYYKTDKTNLYKQKQISTSLRDISQYRMYNVPATNDTAFYYLHMCHLKSGSMAPDEFQRQSEINAFCTNISNIPVGANMFFAGDFNIYSSAEAAWILLTTSCSHVFKDPINLPGLWNNNSLYKSIHTQSTRTSANSGCCGGSTGGLDDRFDIIFVNNPVLTGSDHITYIANSYETIGNDGQHFNLSINESPANTSVPTNVAQALFNMSDHLPVVMKFIVKESPVGLDENKRIPKLKYWINSSNNKSSLHLYSNVTGSFVVKLLDVTGKEVIQTELIINEINIENSIELQGIQPGIYFIKINNGQFVIKDKLLVSP
ncbi:MAG: T9SS type A sorting domain-containing protein [Bacteroidia bacterium]